MLGDMSRMMNIDVKTTGGHRLIANGVQTKSQLAHVLSSWALNEDIDFGQKDMFTLMAAWKANPVIYKTICEMP